MNTSQKNTNVLTDYLACHQHWGECVKPKAIVFVLGESNGTKIPPFYTPHFGWQDLSQSPAAIALFLVEVEGWKSANPDQTVDAMLLAIKRTGRDAWLVGTGKPTPPQVNEMADRLKRTLHTNNLVCN